MDSDGAGKILAVDDVPENVRLLRGGPRPARGYEVVTATSGEEGLDLVASAQPDLVKPVGEFTLKGFQRPVTAFNVVAVRATAAKLSSVWSS